MLVIFEGADGSGKSTLIKQLSEVFNFRTMQVPRYDVEAFHKYSVALMTDDIILCDRSFLSDLVYRLCDDEKPDNMTLYHMLKILKSENCKIVYCKTDTQFDDSIARGETNITSKNKSKQISKTYDLIFAMLEKFTTTSICNYNWQKDVPSKIYNFIKEVE